MKNFRLMKRYRFVLLPIVSGLIIFLTISFLVLPKIKQIIDLKGKIETDKARLSRVTEKLFFIEGLDQYELDRKVDTVEKALPSEKAVAGVLAVLSSLAEESGTSFVTFKIDPGDLVLEKLEEVELRASFVGSRENIKTLLSLIDKVLPVMSIVSYNLEPEEAELNIKSYFSPIPETIGKIDEPLSKLTPEEDEIYRQLAQFKSYEKKLPTVPTGKEDLFATF
jgi:Tfp pilus assembly protein PilO